MSLRGHSQHRSPLAPTLGQCARFCAGAGWLICSRIGHTTASSEETIRDIKPLHQVDYGTPWFLYGLIAAAAAVVVGMVVFFARRRRRPQPTASADPYAQTLAALDALGPPRADNHADARVYHFRLSDILRAYMEAALAVNATDLTREEIMRRLEHTAPIAQQQQLRAELGAVLATTDAVKFAGATPDVETQTQTWHATRQVVEAIHRAVLQAEQPRGEAQ